MGDTIDYRNIMVAVDNSDYSTHGVELGIEIAKAFGGAITKEAEARMERVPSFVKNMARMAILRYAQDKGHTVISTSIVDEAMNVLMPRAAMEAMSGGGRKSDTGTRPMPGMGATGPSVDDEEILWEEDALKELQKIEEPSVREQIRLRTEKLVRIKGMRNVTKGDVMV